MCLCLGFLLQIELGVDILFFRRLKASVGFTELDARRVDLISENGDVSVQQVVQLDLKEKRQVIFFNLKVLPNSS
jgi:hypothetical protein